MLKYLHLAIIFVSTGQGLAGKPDTCTPEFDGMFPFSTMCIEDSDQIETKGVSDEDIKIILDRHNKLRAAVNPSATDLFKLVWDDKVAAVAQKLTQQCSSFHDANRNVPSYSKVHIGQNLAAGQKTWEEAISSWQNEVKNFKFGKGAKSKSKGSVGHYTQIVSNQAIRIGCGFSKCKDGFKQYYTCNYAAGQHGSKVPYTKGKRCSACPNNCKDGLCDCGGLMCLNGGKLDINKCQCTCPKASNEKDCSDVPGAAPAQAPSEEMTKVPNEPSTSPTTKPQNEPTTKPQKEPSTEPQNEPTTKPQKELSTEPHSEPTTQHENKYLIDAPTTPARICKDKRSRRCKRFHTYKMCQDPVFGRVCCKTCRNKYGSGCVDKAYSGDNCAQANKWRCGNSYFRDDCCASCLQFDEGCVDRPGKRCTRSGKRRCNWIGWSYFCCNSCKAVIK